MDRNDNSIGAALFIVVSVLAFMLLGDVVGLIGYLSGHYEIAMAFPGLFLAAVAILAVVRWKNRRGKRPPDAP